MNPENRRSPRRLLFLFALLLGLGSAVPAAAAVESGVRFEEQAVLEDAPGDTALELCATGLLRYRVVFKGYAAALYRDDCKAPEGVLSDAPRRLELSYFWAIDGDKFGEAAETLLRRNLDPAAFAALEERMNRLHASYRSVEPGDRYALTYVPGLGTELALNGRMLTRIEGEDFARAYFGIWLGRNPIDEKLRDALLARKIGD